MDMGRLETVMTLVTLIVHMVFLTMCGMVDLGSPYGNVPADDGFSWAGGDIGAGTDTDTLYVTGVEYPAGYDWVRDMEYGTVECFLFMEKEGMRVLEVPVGFAYETASDPDMHRCIGGHLYTDYSTLGETVVKRDGKEIFRFPGREMFSDFYVSGSDVCTVGIRRSGREGFTYRINGEEVCSVENGRAVSDICFYKGYPGLVYVSETGAGDGGPGDGNYFMISGRDVTPCEFVSGMQQVLAVAMYDDSIYYVTGEEEGDRSFSYALMSDSGMVFGMEVDSYSGLSDCRIYKGPAGAYVSGICRDRISGEAEYVVWDSKGRKYSLAPGRIPVYSFIEGDSIYDLVNPDGQFDAASVYRDGVRLFSYGFDMSIYGAAPAAVSFGKLYTLLVGPLDSRRPYMAEESEVKPFYFNGYFTGVTAGDGSD